MIEGSGRTIIGERGFRCEKARITDMALHINTDGYVNDRRSYSGYDAYDNPYYSPTTLQVALFTRWVAEEMHIHPTDFQIMLTEILATQLGVEITGHKNKELLLSFGQRDEHYSTRICRDTTWR
jgi:hypothetical protein